MLNVIDFLVGKTAAENEGVAPDRANQFGLVTAILGLTPSSLIITQLAAKDGVQTTLPPAPRPQPGPVIIRTIVPDVAGKDLTQINDTFVALGLKFESRDEESTTVPRGLAIRTDPPAGKVVDVASTITVFFSSGPPPNTASDPK